MAIAPEIASSSQNKVDQQLPHPAGSIAQHSLEQRPHTLSAAPQISEIEDPPASDPKQASSDSCMLQDGSQRSDIMRAEAVADIREVNIS